MDKKLLNRYLELINSNKKSSLVADKIVRDINNDLSWNELKKQIDDYRAGCHDNVKSTSNVKNEIGISLHDIDEMHLMYSRHGFDCSIEKIVKTFNITPKQFSQIRIKHGLKKTSDVLSIESKSKMSDTQLHEYMESSARRIIEYKKNDDTVLPKKLLKEAQKHIDGHNMTISNIYKMIDSVVEELPNIKFNKTILKTKTKSNDHIVVSIADIHYGAQVSGLELTPNYSPEITEKLLDKAAERINSVGAKKVTIAFLGDLIESFTGLMHINTWKKLAFGYHGYNLIPKTVELLVNFLTKINNLHQVVGVCGNHDRSTSSKKEDGNGEIASIIYYILNMMLPVEVLHKPTVYSFDVDGINYIITHGDKRFVKKGNSYMVLNYGNPKMYNLILSGHLHTLKIPNDSKTSRHIVCPSIFTGNEFSEDLGYTALSQIAIFKSNGNGLPDMITMALE